MRIIRNWFLSLAWALFLLHSWVPHHHHDADNQAVCVEGEESEDILGLLSFIFHEDLGEHHLEHVSVDQVRIPVFFSGAVEISVPSDIRSVIVLLDGHTEENFSSQDIATASMRGPPQLNA